MNKGKLFFAVLVFSAIIIAVLLATNDYQGIKELSTKLSAPAEVKNVILINPEEIPPTTEDATKINLLNRNQVPYWRGNSQPVLFNDELAVRIIENNLAEGRALYVNTLDLSNVESLQFEFYQEKQKNKSEIVLGMIDSEDNTLSYKLIKELPFNQWHKFTITIASLLEYTEVQDLNFEFDDIRQLWIGSIFPEEERIVFYIKNIYLLKNKLND